MNNIKDDSNMLDQLKKQINALNPNNNPRQNNQYGSPHTNPVSLLSEGFHEILGREKNDHPAAIAFALMNAAMLRKRRDGRILFCNLLSEEQEQGAFYVCGLEGFDLDGSDDGLTGLGAKCLGPDDVIIAHASKEKELYWVAEESLAANCLAAIIIIGSDREKLYNFTISRRLKLRTEDSKTPLYLVRNWKSAQNTAAHARWRITRSPSAGEMLHTPGRTLLGAPRFSLQMEKPLSANARHQEFQYDPTHGFCLVDTLENRSAGKTAVMEQHLWKKHPWRAA